MNDLSANSYLPLPSAQKSPGLTIPPLLDWIVVGVSAITVAGLLCLMAAWIRFGPGILGDMSGEVGEVLFEQGIRYEKAGSVHNAILAYERALEKPFTNANQPTETRVRLGNLLLWSDGPTAALPYLEVAVQEANHSIWVYLPLCEALRQTNRIDECLQYCATWFKLAKSLGDNRQQADAMLVQGRAQLAKGNLDQALHAFLEGQRIEPTSLNSYYAGQSLLDAGQNQEAIISLELYLKEGSGETAAWAKVLLDLARKGVESKPKS